jgi:hypothetical protein
MTSSHIFYIPLILMAGLVIGLFIGRRSAELQREEDERRQRLQARKRAQAAPASEAPKSGPSTAPNTQ